jgi:hypothetical protein
MNWIEVLAAGAGGGVGGALSGLLAGLLRDRISSRSARQALLVLPVVVGGMVGAKVLGPVATERWADAHARTPAEKFGRVVEKNGSRAPELQAWVRAMQERGVSQEAATAEGRSLGMRGLGRLSDEDLLERARILARGIAAVDVATCAKFARGSAGSAELTALLDQVGEADALALAGIVSRAMLAEVRRTPEARPATTRDDAQAILGAVANAGGPPVLDTVERGFGPGATDEAACAGTRTLYTALPVIDASLRPRLALVLAGL